MSLPYKSAELTEVLSRASSLIISEASKSDLASHEFKQFVYLIAEPMKAPLVVDILSSNQITNAIIYVRTNFAADDLAEKLNRAGITAESFHDNKSQRTKNRSFLNFQQHATTVLVATESAATSIRSTEVSVIINYDVPLSVDTYVTRLRSHEDATGSLRSTYSLCDKSEQRHLSNLHRRFLGEIKVINRYL